jgi:PIN domain nuclease of toxin-antitoxin system
MKTLLLDTHAVLWFWWDEAQLSATAKTLLCDPANRKLVSIASAWETAIKVSRKKLNLGGAFQGFFQQQMLRTCFEWLPVDIKHLELVAGLPFHHSDPFDRLLIAQCLADSLSIVSADSQFDYYGVTRLW